MDRSWMTGLVLGAALLSAAACASTRQDAAPAAPALAGTHASAEALAEELLEVLETGDRDALGALAVTEDEFRDFVWPGLDAARPERRLPWHFVWQQHELHHERGIDRALHLFGGQSLELVGIDFEGRVTQHDTPHGSYTIHRDSVVEVRTPDGEVRKVRIFGSMISSGGRSKIYSFITD
jgi:hypothetical protein